MAQGVPVTAISVALFTRFRSRELKTFAEKALSALRREFGGHMETPTTERSTLEPVNVA
jgi:6-phosphogluconate dehydrogenase